MIKTENISLYKNVSYPEELKAKIEEIVKNTCNSWQVNRSYEEKMEDTMVGKIAEYVLKDHIKTYSNYCILDYDDFREDDFKIHAPLDCIIFEKENDKIKDKTNYIKK